MFSDEELTLYLAGSASADLAARIEAGLAADPALEERLMALDDLAPLVQQGVALITRPSVPAVAPEPAPGWLKYAACFALGGALTAGLIWGFQGNARDWRMAVAEYQVLYAPETIAALNFSPAELAAQMAAAEARIGATALYDPLVSIPDLTLLRVQTLAYEGAPLVQMVYATASGEPVALCVLRDGSGAGASMSEAMMREGLASVSFSTPGYAWILIGTEDQDFIWQTGQTIAEALGTVL